MLFYLNYFYRKLFTNIFEIVQPRWAAYLLHMAYIASKFFKQLQWQNLADFNEIVTTEAHYFIRPKTFDAICASPDYERPDVDLTKQLLAAELAQGETVLYLDIGANIGCYSIRVANAFRNTEGLSILAYEPYQESYDLLQRNIHVNDLSGKICARNTALGETPGTSPLCINDIDAGSNSLSPRGPTSGKIFHVSVSRLDDDEIAWKARKNATAVFLKLDCEGMEVPALRGGKRFLAEIPNATLMVEDCVDSRVQQFLANQHWELFAKLTPYNSFWRRVAQ